MFHGSSKGSGRVRLILPGIWQKMSPPSATWNADSLRGTRPSREVETYLPSARLISLDHDLEPQPGEPPDLGDGMVVARALASRRVIPCPANGPV